MLINLSSHDSRRGEQPSSPKSTAYDLYLQELAMYSETWEQFRVRRMKEIPKTLALGPGYGVEMHRKNLEALLNYYEHEATGFAPEHRLWVKDGCIHYVQPPGGFVLWEDVSLLSSVYCLNTDTSSSNTDIGRCRPFSSSR